MNRHSIKLWWASFLSWNSLLRIFEAFGILWLIIQVTSFFFEPLGGWFKGVWWAFLLTGIIIAAVSAWPKLRVTSIVANRDIRISIVVADIFNESGDIIVPSNTTFDTDLQSGIISPKSVQGQFTNRYLPSVNTLDSAIEHELNGIESETLSKRRGKEERYEIGTVCRISTKGPTGYFVAVCHMNAHGNAEGQFQYLLDVLPKMWQFIAQKGQKERICMPVLGSGFSRVTEKRETIIKEIIKSFIASCAESTFCDDLIICIHPEDFSKHKINLTELGEFLTYQCRYTDFSGGYTQGIGTEVEER